MWNPDVYLAFSDHRGRPFFDLLARVGADAPRRVADLGCGPGNLTVTLAQRWPGAVIEAVDSSPEMVEAARARGLDAAVGEVGSWRPRPDTDVVVTNAVLQWVPGHLELMVRWAGELPAGAWIAMQVPGNFDAPSHRAVREVAGRPDFAAALAGVHIRGGEAVQAPVRYAEALTAAGCTVDAWETTYVHELHGEDPVLDWITGTALTEIETALPGELWQRYRAEIRPLLAEAYPAGSDGRTFFPFRRIFVVARVGS
ncbi:trans-aconitate 2-methyltransferase [Mycolicibacterium palauense]|uniref:trans-aconitate 2-methyltransferase n=1 Tax=Mycolicibacterium palauense TaxID=2034511 RepID=UPI000BFED460|nr:trans-aconitate 2-methyltransferase [Mycolicibacterium palauense]